MGGPPRFGIAVRELCQSSVGFADSSFRKGALTGGALQGAQASFRKGGGTPSGVTEDFRAGRAFGVAVLAIGHRALRFVQYRSPPEKSHRGACQGRRAVVQYKWFPPRLYSRAGLPVTYNIFCILIYGKLRAAAFKILPPGRSPRVTIGKKHRDSRLLKRYAWIRLSGFWDEAFYRTSHPDLHHASVNLFRHFMLAGWREGRDPSSLFSTNGYLEAYPDVRQAGVNPLIHYLTAGKNESRSPRPRASSAPLAPAAPEKTRAADAGAPSAPPLCGVTAEDIQRVKESGLFSSVWYYDAYPDLRSSERKSAEDWAIEHYLSHGWQENRSPGHLFPARQYAAAYPDLQGELPLAPLLHYLRYGKSEGRVLPGAFPIASPGELETSLFRRQQDEFTEGELRAQLERFGDTPLISIVMPLYNAPAGAFTTAIESILRQVYAHFELIAVDDGSEDRRPGAYLRKLAKQDRRIKYIAQKKNKGIAAATNIGLEQASGPYIAFMDQDDALTPDALFWVAREINQYPKADFIYTDEAKICPGGTFLDFFLKPDWSPERLMSFMYTGHLNVVKTSLARRMRLDSAYDTAQDLDFALKCTEQAVCIRHISRVLYLWRALESSVASDRAKLTGPKQYSRDIGFQVHSAAFKRRGIDAVMSKMPHSDRIQLRAQSHHYVSLILAANSYEDVAWMFDNLLHHTVYDGFELVVVSDGLTHKQIREAYSYRDDFVLAEYSEAPGAARQYNAGAAAARGDILVFISPGVIVHSHGWLQLLTEYLSLPGVGGVCGMMINAERKDIRAAGYYTGGRGYFTPRLAGYPEWIHSDKYYGSLREWIQNISVLNPELFAVTRAAYNAVEGFDEVHTPARCAVGDFSLRLLEKGYRNLYTPYSKALYKPPPDKQEYFEPDDSCEELYILRRWPDYLSGDPYYPAALRAAIETDPVQQFSMSVPEWTEAEKGQDAILLVTHDLSRTGAPMTILYMARTLRKLGLTPIVVSPKDGQLRRDFEEDGIPVMVDTSLFYESYLFTDHGPFLHLAKCCRLTVVNVSESCWIVHSLQKANIPYLWWIHEGKGIQETAKGSMFVTALSRAAEVYLASPYSEPFLKAIQPDIQTHTLFYGLEDTGLRPEAPPSEKTRFIIIGTFDRRKAQDIVIDACFELPEELRRQMEIHMVCVVYDQAFYDSQYTRAARLPQIFFHESMPHDEVVALIQASDILLCPSRDDPMPIVVTEGWMCSKTCIVSDCTGSASLIEDGISGFVVPAGDAAALAERMRYAVEHKDELGEMGARARKIYEEHFTMDVFEGNVEKLIKNHIL